MMYRFCFLFLLLNLSFASENPLLVVKSVKGEVLQYFPHGADKPLRPYTKIPMDFTLETKAKAEASLRLFLAPGQVDLQPNTKLKIQYKKLKEKALPFLELLNGELILNISKEAGLIYPVNTENTLVESEGARWYQELNSEGATKLVVLKGKIKVYNRPKDMSAYVTEGKTCISDLNGLKIGNSTEEDLLLFRQNLLELDFIDPVTEQTKTLEIEYESNF